VLKFILVFLLLLVSQPCLAQTNVLTVEGYGSSHSSALSDAKRKAVEQGIGTLIASQTVVKNFQLISDRIYSKADGFVKSYKELGSRQESDGSFVVKIEAEVTAILDEVVKDQMATDLLLQWMHKPRFMFLIDEENVGDRSSMVAETEIGRLMDQKGFPVVSRYQIDQIKKRLSDQGDHSQMESCADKYQDGLCSDRWDNAFAEETDRVIYENWDRRRSIHSHAQFLVGNSGFCC